MIIEICKSMLSLFATIVASSIELYSTITGVIDTIKNQMLATVFGVSFGVVVFVGGIITIVRFIKDHV